MTARTTRTLALAAAAALTCSVGAASPAEAAATKIVAKEWHLYATDDTRTDVSPGGSNTACASAPVDEIALKVRVQHAHEGASFREVWTLDGERQGSFRATWSKSGSFTDFFTWSVQAKRLAPQGLQDGTWKVTMSKHGTRLGGAKVTLFTDSSC